MPGAPKQFKREDVLQKALEVFWQKGYESTSMQDLVNAMGINRASMYDTFGNKSDLFNEAFDRYCSVAKHNIETILNSGGSPLARIKAYFELVSQPHDGKNFGCFVNNVAIELGPHDPEVAGKVSAFWKAIEDDLKQTIDQAINSGELKTDNNSAILASLINTVSQGMAAMSKAGVDPAQSKLVYERLLSLLSN